MIACNITFADLLPTLVAAILGLTQFFWSRRVKKREARMDLSKRLEGILKITIEYPELEDQAFVDQWDAMKDKGDERYMRYNQFSDILFNFLSDVYKHFNGNKEKIEEFVDVKTWVRIHSCLWLNPKMPGEIVDGYSENFRKFINSYIQP